MPRKPCYWTRRLELQLVEFVRQKEFIWKPIGNTNHHIQQKYKAYAEFASILGPGFTARSVRDRWVNIRSTFNHNLRKVLKSQETAKCPEEVYTPCWPLWKPLQFLKDPSKSEDSFYEEYSAIESSLKPEPNLSETLISIRQRGQHIDRPKKKTKKKFKQCKDILDNLLIAMAPLKTSSEGSSYWYFGRHVTERLNAMRSIDAKCAGQEILKLLEGNENSQLNSLGS
ncbi:unnamed protein product [Pieris macdunnoughi]|uniref:MADF domain-containing protein n=1 Tax=Pieris macdunnoughi TaxID=345717 RepID=A0A821M8S4_9NEOP|nr:unnamed protein product [Pieris macdunnoughi]